MTAVVCLATFNGERWLREQIESVREQTHRDWQLLVSDHGSSDGTTEILQGYAAADDRIELLPAGAMPGGPAENFHFLLTTLFSRGFRPEDTIFFCDQDDRWDPKKIERQIKALETASGTFSDLVYLSQEGIVSGRRVLPTLKAVLPPTIESLLVQNAVVGCTLGFRAELLDLALPFPKGLVNHDWWLGLCALCIGELAFINEPLVAYRQHGGNAVGGSRPWRQLLSVSARARRQQKVLKSQIEGARVLAERLEDREFAVPEVLKRYLRALTDRSALQRVRVLGSGDFAAPAIGVRLLRVLAALRI
ncbi:MAG: glycosyltransferase family 2 protein [Pseudomonadota bacterium]